jgi:hypothetical protein
MCHQARTHPGPGLAAVISRAFKDVSSFLYFFKRNDHGMRKRQKSSFQTLKNNCTRTSLPKIREFERLWNGRLNCTGRPSAIPLLMGRISRRNFPYLSNSNALRAQGNPEEYFTSDCFRLGRNFVILPCFGRRWDALFENFG